ncbi:hypothetical protein [Halocatena pleomorpha]|uniref:Uncharacterized protein n=1 Tax=Halocatena pleomorpha TaxID=1785090 RepID=A0A3P3RBT1_9EURY|nr:hypothetical protein [Halocatena pleomorpha]RRJ30784.1 hypothetical protein EIK79_09135 [Halocatena pleomorpha]
MSLDISVGFLSPPENPADFPGLEGGIRITVDNIVLTRRKNFQSYYDELYNSNGRQHDHDPAEYPGRWLNWNLDALKDAVLRFQQGEFDRYEEVPAKMEDEPGFSTIILSFCDGEHVRIAYQPVSADIGYHIPVKSTIGYSINPDELCHELVGCYQECICYVENAYTDWDYGDLSEEINEIQRWADEHIQELLAVISDDNC